MATSDPGGSDHFWKYKFPPTKRSDIIKALIHFEFTESYNDDITIYFVKGDNKVPVPREPVIVSLPMHDIVQQISRSGITEEQFMIYLKEIS